jgi:hypothetical protein
MAVSVATRLVWFLNHIRLASLLAVILAIVHDLVDVRRRLLSWLFLSDSMRAVPWLRRQRDRTGFQSVHFLTMGACHFHLLFFDNLEFGCPGFPWTGPARFFSCVCSSSRRGWGLQFALFELGFNCLNPGVYAD